MTPVEEKVIKGITLKNVMWLISSTVTVVTSVLLTYSSLSSKIDAFMIKQGGEDAIQNMKLQNLEKKNEELMDLLHSMQQK